MGSTQIGWRIGIVRMGESGGEAFYRKQRIGSQRTQNTRNDSWFQLEIAKSFYIIESFS